MELSHWLSPFSICLLGAMSLGPSLAAFLNPELAILMLALFAQFLDPMGGLHGKRYHGGDGVHLTLDRENILFMSE